MGTLKIVRKDQQKKVLKASLLNPKNLFVLAIGLATGAISYVLIPVGILAYGILCYLDVSSKDFVDRVLGRKPNNSSERKIRPISQQQATIILNAEDLQQLQTNIMTVREKIQHLYEEADDFTQNILRGFFQIDNLVERSEAFLLKAQKIRNYLISEDIDRIQQDITSLEEKIRNVDDSFSKRQYQQALEARYKHLESLYDIQQFYQRLASQLTNISISLDSVYSRIMKLKTSEYSQARIESEEVSAQLTQLMEDVEQLDTALSRDLNLPE